MKRKMKIGHIDELEVKHKETEIRKIQLSESDLKSSLYSQSDEKRSSV